MGMSPSALYLLQTGSAPLPAAAVPLAAASAQLGTAPVVPPTVVPSTDIGSAPIAASAAAATAGAAGHVASLPTRPVTVPAIMRPWGTPLAPTAIRVAGPCTAVQAAAQPPPVRVSSAAETSPLLQRVDDQIELGKDSHGIEQLDADEVDITSLHGVGDLYAMLGDNSNAAAIVAPRANAARRKQARLTTAQVTGCSRAASERGAALLSTLLLGSDLAVPATAEVSRSRAGHNAPHAVDGATVAAAAAECRGGRPVPPAFLPATEAAALSAANLASPTALLRAPHAPHAAMAAAAGVAMPPATVPQQPPGSISAGVLASAGGRAAVQPSAPRLPAAAIVMSDLQEKCGGPLRGAGGFGSCLPSAQCQVSHALGTCPMYMIFKWRAMAARIRLAKEYISTMH